jgi:hypothetical protein
MTQAAATSPMWHSRPSLANQIAPDQYGVDLNELWELSYGIQHESA